MKKKEGQVTIFVILGILLLVGFIFMLIFIQMIDDLNNKREAQEAVQNYLDSANINYYVYTCIDTAAKEAVEEIALQGGTYWKYQGGPKTLRAQGETHIEYDGKNVSYSIYAKDTCPTIGNKNVPLYPMVNEYLANLKSKYNLPENGCIYSPLYKDSGFFGYNKLPRLCYPRSQNKQNLDNVSSVCTGNFMTTINESIEEQLRKRISNRTEECINFTKFQEAGHNITIINQSNTSLRFDQDSFLITVEYPFEVKLQGKEPVLIRHEFNYDSNLRITLLNKYLLRLLKEETQDIFFNLTTDYPLVQGYESLNLEIKIINFTEEQNTPYQYDHILILKDHSSKIRSNESLTFMTAIKNRTPALDYIRQTPQDASFDIIVEENETININPLGIDPDDKPVIYSYFGWKETWDEAWNFTNCPIPGIYNTKQRILNCMNIDLTTQPLNWSNSTIFKDTQRNASYKTNLTDIGIHNTTVYVEDESGARDWQTLSILVIDKPDMNLTFENPYSDIPENYTSIEDYFTLSAQGSTPSSIGGGTITNYLWEILDANNNRAVQNTTSTDKLKVPKDTDGTYNILNIKQMNLTSTGTHKASVTLQTSGNQFLQGISGTKTMEIEVLQCLPHRDASPAYPYNTTDGFLANHTCCIQNTANPLSASLAPTSTICYEEDKQGEFNALLNHYSQNLKISPTQNDKENIQQPNTQQENDVYELEFERNCDGSRGNICTGEMDATLTIIQTCQDDGADAVCSGPTTSMSTAVVCTDYPTGKTFATEFKGSTSSYCDQTPRCSNPGVNGYNVSSGKHLCKAQCDGLGNCNYADNCVCDAGCGATCYPGRDSYEDVTTNTCHYGGCDANTCDFKNSRNYNYYCSGGKKFCEYNGLCIYNLRCTSSGIDYDSNPYCGGTCHSDGSCS